MGLSHKMKILIIDHFEKAGIQSGRRIMDSRLLGNDIN